MAETVSSSDLQARKALGRAHLNANRLHEALAVFAGILKEDPEDVEIYLLLGDCYLASDDPGTALQLYRRAQELAPAEAGIAGRLRLAQDELAHLPSDQAEAVPTDAGALSRLLQRLTGRPMVSEPEILKAAEVLEEIVDSPRPALAVAARLSDIDALLPALLELNIRQARADGRPDLAEALTHLLDNIQLQLKTVLPPEPPKEAPAPKEPETPASEKAMPAGPAVRRPSVLFVGPPSAEASLRQTLPAEALRALGCEAAVSADFASQQQRQFDVVVVRRPQADPELMDGLVACVAFGARVILDLEADFTQMPAAHPDYTRLGVGAGKKAKVYQDALRLAHLICAQSQTLARTLRSAGYPVTVMPPGWSRNNRLWNKAVPPREALTIGWIGAPGQVDDVAEIRRPVLRLLREFPQTQLVIGGDPQVAELFRALPKDRKQFLPPVSFEEQPYLMSQVDILLVPQQATPFNATVSDLRLMEAGIRGVPWIASPLPAYESWGEGGVLARTPDEWYASLRALIVSPERRAELGAAGRQQAEEREMSRLGPAWLEMVEKVWRGPRGRAKV